ncbi:MAG: histidyl-tRNA synthetase [Clostridia bacterium]|nr:histidyl-tRNA synthetase [Clostridia bacterium]
MLTTRPRGTEDILPEEIEAWYYLESTAREVCRQYGYREIRTPIFEHTELFNRSVGETSDIVSKEMYTFDDRGGRSITLRPEGTAPVVRAFLEHHLYAQVQPVKLFYLGPMFRYGRPQAGRLRQFHQFGVEAFGSQDPAIDAEVIALAMDFYRRLGLKNLELHLNSVGCPACRSEHRARLQEFLRDRLSELCPTCRERFERNPLRIFDCKEEACREMVARAPTITEALCGNCAAHFQAVQRYLRAIGIEFQVDTYLVRGLDYYTHTAFEIMVEGIGAQSSIGGGGRYNGLVEACGGPPTPGVGFGLGLERILLALKAQGWEPERRGGADVLVLTAGPGLEEQAFRLTAALRAAGLAADKDYLGRSLKAQMKYAGRYPVKLAVILGPEEWGRGRALVRDLAEGWQEEVPLNGLIDYCQKRKGCRDLG